MIASLVSFPRESSPAPVAQDWRSIGDAAGHVVSRVAYRCSPASKQCTILREEGGDQSEAIWIAVPAE